MTGPGPNGAAAPTRPLLPVPDLFAHHPPPRADGRLDVTISYLEMARPDWTPRGTAPDFGVDITHEVSPSVALYRNLHDTVGRPWLWYERRLGSDSALATMLAQPRHELHIARAARDSSPELIGFFELDGGEADRVELAFFGLTLAYVGRRVGPWLLDRAIERAFASGADSLAVNTNTLDHPGALGTYRKAGFRLMRTEARELRDPRMLWPDLYRWPPA
jgi:ribosomal protein S18 acetylase RimI-like enzyme